MINNILLWTALLSVICHGALAKEVVERKMPNASLKRRAESENLVRTFMTVEYDYRLEVNRTQSSDNNTSTEESIFDAVGGEERDTAPLENALLDIDTDIISTLQERIPGGVVKADQTLPDVHYTTINSRFINMCFTESDACKFVKSRIKLSFVGNLPRAAMERVTLDLVREYLKDVAEATPSLDIKFVYPMIHSSTTQLDLSPVEGPMESDDIEHLTTVFYSVFQAIVSALDGDTEISEVFFVYQDVGELDGNAESNAEDQIEANPFSLSVNLKYFGKCRSCTEDDLYMTMQQTFESNKKAFLSNLKKNGRDTEASYFQSIEDVSFTKFSTPDGLSETAAAIGNVGVASKKTPWFMYIGVGAAVLVLAVGVYVIVKDQKELRKEDPDTGPESSDDSEKAEIGNAAGNPGLNSNASSTSSLNTNTLNQTGMHSDYEVYVY